MIVRLMGQQGQWRLDDALQAELNAIDAQLDADALAGDGGEFAAHLASMHELIRAKGTPVGEDEFLPSDAFVPPLDISLDELRTLLSSEGLSPG